MFGIEIPEEHRAYWHSLAENIIRSETTNDHDALREIHRLAFGGPAEAKLVDDLRLDQTSKDQRKSLAPSWRGRIAPDSYRVISTAF
jgi:hypothetical protein